MLSNCYKINDKFPFMQKIDVEFIWYTTVYNNDNTMSRIPVSKNLPFSVNTPFPWLRCQIIYLLIKVFFLLKIDQVHIKGRSTWVFISVLRQAFKNLKQIWDFCTKRLSLAASDVLFLLQCCYYKPNIFLFRKTENCAYTSNNRTRKREYENRKFA